MTSILVTNDDGYAAPGILALAEAMRSLGDVQVCAPLTNQSASGHKLTLFQDIRYQRCVIGGEFETVAVDGSPADCIALALLGLVEQKPDIVVSGINRGENMSQDLTYSGTVTAALEAAINGYPAVAVSLADTKADCQDNYAVAAHVAQAVVRETLARSLPPLTILNVNVPPVARLWTTCAASASRGRACAIIAISWCMSARAWRALAGKRPPATWTSWARIYGRCIAIMSA